ncbi:MAG: methyltransferase domain-containing protein [Methanomicrobiales archaeon]|nr:methyltransferase domain-containing protein [Methanomicrobiales archaeon]
MKDVWEAFDRGAREYDAQREHVIPHLRDFYEAAVSAASSEKKAPAILDLGAGTGLLSAHLLQKYPDAEIALIDLSERMLDVARRRLADAGSIRYITADYSRCPLGGPYDLVCSALSIHHLAPEKKRDLFVRIYRSLVKGGMFVNADQTRGETEFFERMYLQYWNDFLEKGPLTDAERAEICRRRDELDRNDRLSLQLQWLKESGFTEIDTIYKNRTFTVIAARKT